MEDAHFEDEDTGERFKVLKIEREVVKVQSSWHDLPERLSFQDIATMMDWGLRFTSREAHEEWHQMGGF